MYLGQFEGWYDQGQEEYYTEMKAKELDFKSPITGRDLVRATEENYYFRLSAFSDRLQARRISTPSNIAAAPHMMRGRFYALHRRNLDALRWGCLCRAARCTRRAVACRLLRPAGWLATEVAGSGWAATVSATEVAGWGRRRC